MTTLAALLADPQEPIAFVVELTYRDPDTDTISTVRITDGLWVGAGEVGYLKGLLDDPGEQGVQVEVDEIGAIAAASLDPMRFLNPPPAPGGVGPLDFLRTMSLSGRAVTLLAGSPTEAIANYEELGSGLADGEPEFDDEAGVMTLRRKTALDRLDVDLDVGTYVGEPGALEILTVSAIATVADTAAHHLLEFTIAFRWKHPTGSGAFAPSLSRRQTSTTAQNWDIRLGAFSGGNAGKLLASYSTGGVANGLSLASTDRYDDDVVHYGVFARSSSHAYIMVDGEVVAESTSPSTPDQPTAGVSMGTSFQVGPGWFTDERILDHYLPPDEARSWMTTRATGDESGLVGLWRGDDAIGTTLTDYSATSANATIAGTEGVDFDWVSSDLGEPEIAGQSANAGIGAFWNAPADIVSSAFERWRYNDRNAGVSGTEIVRDQGQELTVSTDYTIEDEQIIALVAEAGEPLTYGVSGNGSTARLPLLLEQIIHTEWAPVATAIPGRGPVAQETIAAGGHSWTQRLRGLFRSGLDAELSAGIWTRRRPAGEVVEEILRGTLSHLTLKLDGSLEVSALTPPVSPGPRNGSCLEFRGDYISFSNHGASVEWSSSAGPLTGKDFTLAFWCRDFIPSFLSNSISQGALVDLSDSQSVSAVSRAGVQLIWGDWQGGRRMVLWSYDGAGGGVGTISNINILWGDPGAWHFVAVVHDDIGGETRWYSAPLGGTLSLVYTSSDLGLAGIPPAKGVIVGGNGPLWGSIAEPSVWDETRTLSELQSQMNDGLTGSELNLAFYAPLDGISSASLTDSVSSEVGTASSYVEERPNLVVDLTRTPRPFRRRRLNPAKRIEVKYHRNFKTLGPEQIAATVSRSDRLDLQNEWRSALWKSPDVEDDFLDAREVVLETPWYSVEGAQSTLRMARVRYGANSWYAVLGPSPGAPLREALLLEVGDEVQVIGYQDLAAPGITYRVVGNRRILSALDSELRLWTSF